MQSVNIGPYKSDKLLVGCALTRRHFKVCQRVEQKFMNISIIYLYNDMIRLKRYATKIQQKTARPPRNLFSNLWLRLRCQWF